MGFHVSTLHNLPVGNIQYFVHVIDISSGLHSRWISENLHTLSARFGPNAGLVTGPLNLSQELFQFLSVNLSSDFGQVESLLHSATCLLVSEGHLATTRSTIYLIPVATHEETEDSQALIATLICMIAEGLASGKLKTIVSSLGSHELQLRTVGGSFILCNLRRLNNVFGRVPQRGVGAVGNWLGVATAESLA